MLDPKARPEQRGDGLRLLLKGKELRSGCASSVGRLELRRGNCERGSHSYSTAEVRSWSDCREQLWLEMMVREEGSEAVAQVMRLEG